MHLLLSILFFIQAFDVHFVLGVRNVQNQPAKLGEFPFHVSIQNIDSAYHHCGGVIIHPSYVMTAAHCIDGFNPEEFQVVVGTTDLSRSSTIHYVAKLIPHENYNTRGGWNDDIGLIKVQEPFRFNYAINKARLPRHQSDIPPGLRATVIGFGRTAPHGYSSKVLNTAEVLVKNLNHCNEKYKLARMQFSDTQICAQSSNGAGICKGDSGGAFIVNGLVVGISSYTNEDCDHVSYPSIFTKVSKYLLWIRDHVESKLQSKLRR